jgi:cycloeucalenol cycloisomerase
MYLLTHAYFMTYHTSAVVVLRRIRTAGLPGGALLFAVAVFVVGYCWAWLETKAMANPLIAESFYYRKPEMMLAYGSIFYALYFVGSFPIFYFIDEREAERWDLRKTAFAALAASMIVLYLLDFWTKIVGALG